MAPWALAEKGPEVRLKDVYKRQAFALGFAFSGYPLLCYLAAGLHLSGCVGDWYYVRTILRDRRIVACEDTSFGVRFFAR